MYKDDRLLHKFPSLEISSQNPYLYLLCSSTPRPYTCWPLRTLQKGSLFFGSQRQLFTGRWHLFISVWLLPSSFFISARRQLHAFTAEYRLSCFLINLCCICSNKTRGKLGIDWNLPNCSSEEEKNLEAWSVFVCLLLSNKLGFTINTETNSVSSTATNECQSLFWYTSGFSPSFSYIVQ